MCDTPECNGILMNITNNIITNILLMIMSRTYIKLIAFIFHQILLLGFLPFANFLGLN